MKIRWYILLVVMLPGMAEASDFTPLMWFLLIPYGLAALVVWLVTWLATSNVRLLWVKVVIRVFGLCLIFTPTHTAGDHGQMYSVALYDIVMSSLGGSSNYAKQAFLNVLIATIIISALVIAGIKIRNENHGSR